MKPGIQNEWKELHAFLSKNSIRFFDIRIDDETTTLAHPNKTVNDWRDNLRSAIAMVAKENQNGDKGSVSLDLIHTMIEKFGYIEIRNLVDDVYEGRTKIKECEIIDAPLHEDQKDGFGHYGWNNIENRIKK